MRPPYGSRTVSASSNEGNGSLYWVLADGASSPERIGPPGHFHPHAWTPDSDLIAVSLSGREAISSSCRRSRMQSPGRPSGHRPTKGLLRRSRRTGSGWPTPRTPPVNQEIWVRPYPGPGAPLRVSPRGGWEPAWARDGLTLFYVEGREVMAVAVDTAAGFDFGAPVPLFDGRIPIGGQPPSYDVAADGRFVTTGAGAIPPVSVILDWPEMLRARGGDD